MRSHKMFSATVRQVFVGVKGLLAIVVRNLYGVFADGGIVRYLVLVFAMKVVLLGHYFSNLIRDTGSVGQLLGKFN